MSSKATFLLRLPHRRSGIYAFDGVLVEMTDKETLEISKVDPDWLKDGPKIHLMPYATPIYYYQPTVDLTTAGHRFGDYPSEPKWMYDPNRISVQSIPLDRYAIGGYVFYGRWLGAWGERIWAITEPVPESVPK